MMTTTRHTMRRIAATLAVSGLVAAAVLGGSATASATEPGDAPAGYAGPFNECKGAATPPMKLEGTSGYVQVWYSSEGSGTFCAMTFDNLPGKHHTEIVLQRDDWQTQWYDSGMYSTYAGGIYVSGANSHCAFVYGEVTVDGVAHKLDAYEHWALACPF
jgi:hypothetical protein